MNQPLKSYLNDRVNEFELIPEERKQLLAELGDYVKHGLANAKPVKLTFLCTHNSRRSHLSQIMAHVASEYYQLKGIETFSGGTEVTAFNPRAVAALQRAGIRISTSDASIANPRYIVRGLNDESQVVCFSKTLLEPPNPTSGYCAVMTCSHADEACPVVLGCEKRLPIRYDDPKVSDDTERETACYDERTRQISREMLYAMSIAAS